MAELRLIAIAVSAVLAGAACRPSDAGPASGSAAGHGSGLTGLSGLNAPAGWRAMPNVSKAAEEIARGAKLHVEGAEAWGEPSRGCYAAWLAVRGAAGAPDAIAERMVADLSATKALPGIGVSEVVTPAKKVDVGVLTLAFEASGHHGRLAAQIAKTGATSLIACFWNEREPNACAAACKPMLESRK